MTVALAAGGSAGVAAAAAHRPWTADPRVAGAPAPVAAAAAGAKHKHKGAKKKKKNKKKPGPPRLHGDAGRAQQAYTALQHAYYLPRAHLYSGNPYSYLWPFSQTLTATLGMNLVPHAPRDYRRDLSQRLDGLRLYYHGTAAPLAYEGGVASLPGNDGRVYYDDNEWVALELLRVAKLTHKAAYVARARELFDTVTTAWSADPNLGCPGGVPFSSRPDEDQRNVVTDGPGAELGVRLYQLTGDASTLGWARKMYDWVRSCLSAGGDLYADHIDPRGVVTPTLWSYNQGTMIGAGVMLFQATHESHYLADAEQTAAAALDSFGTDVLEREPPFFVSVFLRNLLLLNSVRPDSSYVAAARAYAGWAYSHARNPHTQLYSFQTGGSPVLDQASMANIFSFLASPPSALF